MINEWEMCNALTRIGSVFCRRRFLCVPNVSWGWGLDYEADLIALNPSGYCAEVEIKISVSDLRNDSKKAKWRSGLDSRIKRFFYAVPEDMAMECLKSVHPDFGVIEVKRRKSGDLYSEVVRKAADQAGHRKVTDAEVTALLRLAALRYWDIRHDGIAPRTCVTPGPERQ